MDIKNDGYKLIIVGAGFFGATIAHKVACDLALPVLIIERRNHIGGNAYSEIDAVTGIEYHRYGSHLFHTSNDHVWRFVNQFSEFNNYRHRVFSRYKGRTYTMPINLMTINQFFGVELTPTEARALIGRQAAEAGITSPRNLEEKAISLIGRPLYEAFVKGYTVKQWETAPTLLPPEIITRLPVRFNFNDFYFSDTHEGLPLNGYHALFDSMLMHPKIRVLTRCDFFEARDQISPGTQIIFTGAVDRYFGYRCGELAWRTLDFEIERLDTDDCQGAAVVNYPDLDVPFTRIHEFKHLHPERRYGKQTLIMREYSRFAMRTDEPYYPVGRREDKLRYGQYRVLAEAEPDVIFGGRLGTYRYLDMHQAIGAALLCYEKEVAPALTKGNVQRRAIG